MFNVDIIAGASPFPYFPPSPSLVLHPTIVHVREHAHMFLAIPLTFFIQSSPPTSPSGSGQSVPCLWFHFVNQIILFIRVHNSFNKLFLLLKPKQE